MTATQSNMSGERENPWIVGGTLHRLAMQLAAKRRAPEWDSFPRAIAEGLCDMPPDPDPLLVTVVHLIEAQMLADEGGVSLTDIIELPGDPRLSGTTAPPTATSRGWGARTEWPVW